MPRLQLIGLAALALLTPGVGAARPAGAVEIPNTFKDWTVICDNLRNCEADGFSVEEAEKPAILQLNRSGAPGSSAEITIWLLADDAVQAARGKVLALAVDDRPILTVRAGDDGSARLAAAQVAPLLNAARHGTVLSIRQEDDELGVVSLAGMVAALRLADDQQKRVGTVTAMVAKGSALLATIPPQPAPSVVRRAPAVAQTGLPGKPPPSVKALATKAKCEAGSDDGAPEARRLSADLVLWQVPCGAGADNSTSLLAVIDSHGKVRVAPIEGVRDGLVDGGAYDPQTRIFTSITLGRRVGDCGDSTEWAWTGQDFELTKMTSMPLCRGQAAWPTSFQARVE